MADPLVVELTRDRIDPGALAAHVADGATGATAIFLGTVRAEHRDRAVLRLDYEAYSPMALREMRRIAEELRERFPVRRAAIIHRLGTLGIGETSIGIALSLPHRADSFAALRYAIDAFKERVPIWKREHFADGEAEWVEGS